MIRILHSVSNMDRGGIETMLMNYYRHIDRSEFQFDFLCNKPKPGAFDDEIRAMGGNIYISPGLSPAKYPEYMRFMKKLLSENKSIKVLHAHNEAMALYALQGAKKAGLPARIHHAHNTSILKDYKYPLKIFCKQFLPYAATDLWSCGTDAGVYYYGKNRWQKSGHIMHNATDLSKFGFDSGIRAAVREEYGLTDKFVIGNVGRFNLQKNHTRILDIFASLQKIRPDACLVLIGEGELESQMKQKAAELGISDSVRFMGLRSDVDRWYQAFDVFLMPSLFEGLPVVGIEAQASGLPCVFSDTVTNEAAILKTSRMLSLSASNEEWAQTIVSCATPSNVRHEAKQIVRASGYDIVEEARKLQNLYRKMSQRK